MPSTPPRIGTAAYRERSRGGLDEAIAGWRLEAAAGEASDRRPKAPVRSDEILRSVREGDPVSNLVRDRVDPIDRVAARIGHPHAVAEHHDVALIPGPRVTDPDRVDDLLRGRID